MSGASGSQCQGGGGGVLLSTVKLGKVRKLAEVWGALERSRRTARGLTSQGGPQSPRGRPMRQRGWVVHTLDRWPCSHFALPCASGGRPEIVQVLFYILPCQCANEGKVCAATCAHSARLRALATGFLCGFSWSAHNPPSLAHWQKGLWCAHISPSLVHWSRGVGVSTSGTPCLTAECAPAHFLQFMVEKLEEMGGSEGKWGKMTGKLVKMGG